MFFRLLARTFKAQGAFLACWSLVSLACALQGTPLLSRSALHLAGHAGWIGNRLRLTPANRESGPNISGAVWSSERQPVAEGFDSTFQFRITEPGSPRGYAYGGRPQAGGDGLAFLIQNSSASAVSEAGGGGNLGYGGYEGSSRGGIPNSLAVEFDTFYNPEYHDPNEHHLSVHTRGTAPNSSDEKCSIGAAKIPDLSDGKVHTARVLYVPGLLRVYLDSLKKPVLTVRVDLVRLLHMPEGRAWVGFTASEGGAYENHDLLNWTFASTGSAPQAAPSDLKPTVTFRPRTSAPAAAPSGSSSTGDDWLRPRRDAANTSRSSQPIRIPLQQAWAAELTAVDARVQGNTALILDTTGTVTALDLSTGHEQWRHPGIEVLGDASEDGRLTLLTKKLSQNVKEARAWGQGAANDGTRGGHKRVEGSRGSFELSCHAERGSPDID